MGVPSEEPNLSCLDPPLHCLSNLWMEVSGSRAAFRAITGRREGVPWRGDWSEVSPCRSWLPTRAFPDTHTSRLPSSLSLSLSLLPPLPSLCFCARLVLASLASLPPTASLLPALETLPLCYNSCSFLFVPLHLLQLLFLPRIALLPPFFSHTFYLNSPSN